MKTRKPKYKVFQSHPRCWVFVWMNNMNSLHHVKEHPKISNFLQFESHSSKCFKVRAISDLRDLYENKIQGLTSLSQQQVSIFSYWLFHKSGLLTQWSFIQMEHASQLEELTVQSRWTSVTENLTCTSCMVYSTWFTQSREKSVCCKNS